MSHKSDVCAAVTRRAASLLLATLAALGLVAAPAARAQITPFDPATYGVEATTDIVTEYPFTANQEDVQTGHDPNQTVTSSLGVGTQDAPNIQYAYSYAKPGRMGFFIHGQTAPFPSNINGVYEFSSTHLNARVYENDVIFIPQNAPGPVNITYHFSLDGKGYAGFDPRAATIGLPGDWSFGLGYGAELEVTDLNTGVFSLTKQGTHLNNYTEGWVTDFIAQPFTITANPGDHLSVSTVGYVAVGAEIKGDYFQEDYSHTLNIYADVLTPGVTLTSLSGHDYSTPAPEPSQFAALSLGALGLGGLALRARRRVC